jgi:hypothetical protein
VAGEPAEPAGAQRRLVRARHPQPRRDTYAVVRHDPDANGGDGADILIRHEKLEVLCSFYGPNCQAMATRLGDGISIPQNREALGDAGLKLVEVGEPTKAAEIIKNAWYQRCDLSVWLRREIRREYPILNILSAEGEIASDVADVTFNASP